MGLVLDFEITYVSASGSASASRGLLVVCVVCGVCFVFGFVARRHIPGRTGGGYSVVWKHYFQATDADSDKKRSHAKILCF